MEAYCEKTIDELRRLVDRFLSGTIPFEAFYPQYRMTAHRLFELDDKDLPQVLHDEVAFYLRWEGFGPYDGHVPLNAAWQYGQSTDPFGWIDKPAFRERFSEEYSVVVAGRET
jgi:hypothetical protein